MSDAESTTLFGSEDEVCGTLVLQGCASAPFDVRDHPIIVRAFNLEDDEKIFVEMVAGDNEGEFFETMKSGCGCSVVLTACNNTLILPLSGRYRLNRCVCPDANGDPVTEPTNDLAHVEYQAITTGAVVNHGEVSMACGCETGSEVTVTQPGDGSTIITVDGTPTVIPSIPNVSVTELGDTVVLTVNGTSYQIDKGPDTGAELAALLAFRNCAGGAINSGDSIVLCSELDTAVAALNAQIAAIPDLALASQQSYDPNTNTLTLAMNDGSTVPLDMTALVADAVSDTIVNANIDLTDAFGVQLGHIFP